jgi:hypothetical protein
MAIARSFARLALPRSALPAVRLDADRGAETAAIWAPKRSLMSNVRALRVELSAEKSATKATRSIFTDSRPPGLLTWSLAHEIAVRLGRHGGSAAADRSAASTARRVDSEAW